MREHAPMSIIEVDIQFFYNNISTLLLDFFVVFIKYFCSYIVYNYKCNFLNSTNNKYYE